uniref:hypothetical protein n=1 Tax=Candidatus Electronema sp. TaxID=2698783 RepID=UPI0040572E8B
MSEKELKTEGLENQGRRKTIKKIAVSAAALAGYSVLPPRWTTPVIDVMALPAHAQSSGPAMSGNYQLNQVKLSVLSGNQSSSVVTVSVEGQVSPPVAGQNVEIDFEGSSGTAETGGISKALAAAGSLFVSEAIAKSCGKKKVKTSTKADGKFKVKCNLSCGPGVVQVFVYIIVIGIDIQPITKTIYIPPASTPTTTAAPGTTCEPGGTCAPGTTAAPGGGGTGGGPPTPCDPGHPCGTPAPTPDPNITNPNNPFK